MRWEKERGLPVHRVPGGGRSRVFAFEDELEAWLQAEPPTPEPAIRPSLVVRWRLAFAAAAIVVATIAGAWWTSAGGRDPVADVAYLSDGLIARDGAGRELFRVSLPGKWSHTPHRPGLGLLGRGDFNGDGRDDNLITVPLKLDTATKDAVLDRLDAYTDDGALLWSESNDLAPVFGAGNFGPGYRTVTALPFDYDGQPRIAWSQTHHIWWPTILRVLDAKGAALSTWVHSGVFFTLAFVPTDEGPLLLAGGVSNAQSSGALLALDVRASNGHGPEPAGSEFACVNCSGSDRVVHYLVFPPTEMSAAFGVPYSRVYAIRDTTQGIEVRVRQGSLTPHEGVDVYYSFDRRFRLLHARLADDYWLVHRQMEAKGLLNHSADACPERTQPLRVRELVGHEWRELSATRNGAR